MASPSPRGLSCSIWRERRALPWKGCRGTGAALGPDPHQTAAVLLAGGHLTVQGSRGKVEQAGQNHSRLLSPSVFREDGSPLGRREAEGQRLWEVEGLVLRAAFTHVTGSLVCLKPFDGHCLGQIWAGVTTKSSPLHARASYLCVPVKCPGPCFSSLVLEESPASLGEAGEWGLEGALLLLHSRRHSADSLLPPAP